MILSLDELINRLQAESPACETKPSEALWITFGQLGTRKTVAYRTPSGNEILHVYLDDNDGLVGIEIFP